MLTHKLFRPAHARSQFLVSLLGAALFTGCAVQPVGVAYVAPAPAVVVVGPPVVYAAPQPVVYVAPRPTAVVVVGRPQPVYYNQYHGHRGYYN